MDELLGDRHFAVDAAKRKFQTQICLSVLLGGIVFTVAMVGATLRPGVDDIAIQAALRSARSSFLVQGLAITALGGVLSWLLARRLFHNLASIFGSINSAPSTAHRPGAAAVLAPSWRAFAKDPLTGLFSQSALLAFADDAIPYFRRYKRGVSILMVEIDLFQAVSDRYHAAGADQVLRHVAEVLDLSVRKTDKVARFDANQFIVLLREISEDDTLALANRICEAVSDLGARHADDIIPVTVSIGAAIVAESDMASETLIERAETALAVSKAEGGNRVIFRAASDVRVLEGA